MYTFFSQGHTRPLNQVKYNHDGDLLFSASTDQVVNVWYSQNGELLGSYEGHTGSVFTVDINKDTSLIATGASDGTACLWVAKTGKQLFSWTTVSTVKTVQFSPDGKRLLLVTDSNFGRKATLQVFEINTDLGDGESNIPAKTQSEKPIVLVTNTEFPTYTAAGWTYDGNHVVVGHKDGSISKYNVVDSPEGKLVEHKKVHEDNITDLQMSLDRTYFITSCRDKTARLFSSDTLEELHTYYDRAPLNSAAITPVKDFVILGGGQDAGSVTTTGSQEGDFMSKVYHKVFEDCLGEIRGHFGPINTIAVDPKGKSFATGGEDGLIRLHHFDKSYFDFYYDIERRQNEQEAAAN